MASLSGADWKDFMSGLRMKAVKKMILVTLAAIAVSRIGRYIPLPGLNIAELYGAFGRSWISDYVLTTGAFSKLTIFSLGIMPYVGAAALVLLLSGIFPYFRRLREGSLKDHARFERAIILVTILISLPQAYGISIWMESVTLVAGKSLVMTPGWGFRFLAVITMTSGTLILVWLAHLISRKGIANGVLVIFLADLLHKFIPDAIASYQAIGAQGFVVFERHALLEIIIKIGFPLVLIILSAYVVLGKRTISLKHFPPSSPSHQPTEVVVNVPLRMNVAGSIPAFMALSILYFPVSLATFGLGMGESIYAAVNPGTILYWVLLCLMIVFFAFLVTAIVFSGRDLIDRTRRFGFTIDGMDVAKEVEAEDYVERIVEKSVWLSALFLCVLAAGPYLFSVLWRFTPGLSNLFGPTLLVLVAGFSAVFKQVQTNAKLHRKVWEDEEGRALQWITVFTGETELDGEMVKRMLAEREIEALIISNRAISLAGTFGMWEVCRPTYPSLTVHRRLGGGRVEVKVLEDQVEAARQMLVSREIVSQ